MRFSVLSGAYINAGDFLIVDRSIKLLKNIYEDCEIKIYERRKPLDDYLEEINDSDALIMAGGPAYMPNVYPDIIPLVENLEDIKTKIVPLGLGWCGEYVTNKYIYNDYKFTENTKKLLKRLSQDNENLSCRDWYTARTLKENGFSNVIMTGCPAWYDLDYINSCKIKKEVNIPFKKICVSDPAKTKNAVQAIQLVKYLKEKFKSAEIIFVFHRRDAKKIESDKKSENTYDIIKKEMTAMGIKTVDISGSAEAFSVYNDCDLHIGFRVHAHIYNLSRRNISLLIEEDGRGAGVNQALGLNSIKAYRDKNQFDSKFMTKLNNFMVRNKENNEYLIKNIDDQFDILFNSEFMQYEMAFSYMNLYFEKMKQYIKQIIE